MKQRDAAAMAVPLDAWRAVRRSYRNLNAPHTEAEYRAFDAHLARATMAAEGLGSGVYVVRLEVEGRSVGAARLVVAR